jgi:hypothetical protein
MGPPDPRGEWEREGPADPMAVEMLPSDEASASAQGKNGHAPSAQEIVGRGQGQPSGEDRRGGNAASVPQTPPREPLQHQQQYQIENHQQQLEDHQQKRLKLTNEAQGGAPSEPSSPQSSRVGPPGTAPGLQGSWAQGPPTALVGGDGPSGGEADRPLPSGKSSGLSEDSGGGGEGDVGLGLQDYFATPPRAQRDRLHLRFVVVAPAEANVSAMRVEVTLARHTVTIRMARSVGAPDVFISDWWATEIPTASGPLLYQFRVEVPGRLGAWWYTEELTRRMPVRASTHHNKVFQKFELIQHGAWNFPGNLTSVRARARPLHEQLGEFFKLATAAPNIKSLASTVRRIASAHEPLLYTAKHAVSAGALQTMQSLLFSDALPAPFSQEVALAWLGLVKASPEPSASDRDFPSGALLAGLAEDWLPSIPDDGLRRLVESGIKELVKVNARWGQDFAWIPLTTWRCIHLPSLNLTSTTRGAPEPGAAEGFKAACERTLAGLAVAERWGDVRTVLAHAPDADTQLAVLSALLASPPLLQAPPGNFALASLLQPLPTAQLLRLAEQGGHAAGGGLVARYRDCARGLFLDRSRAGQVREAALYEQAPRVWAFRGEEVEGMFRRMNAAPELQPHALALLFRAGMVTSCHPDSPFAATACADWLQASSQRPPPGSRAWSVAGLYGLLTRGLDVVHGARELLAPEVAPACEDRLLRAGGEVAARAPDASVVRAVGDVEVLLEEWGAEAGPERAAVVCQHFQARLREALAALAGERGACLQAMEWLGVGGARPEARTPMVGHALGVLVQLSPLAAAGDGAVPLQALVEHAVLAARLMAVRGHIGSLRAVPAFRRWTDAVQALLVSVEQGTITVRTVRELAACPE